MVIRAIRSQLARALAAAADTVHYPVSDKQCRWCRKLVMAAIVVVVLAVSAVWALHASSTRYPGHVVFRGSTYSCKPGTLDPIPVADLMCRQPGLGHHSTGIFTWEATP